MIENKTTSPELTGFDRQLLEAIDEDPQIMAFNIEVLRAQLVAATSVEEDKIFQALTTLTQQSS